MGQDCLMPMVEPLQAKHKKPDGSPFTIHDAEYWKLDRDGGIRRHQHFDMPRMLYKAQQKRNGTYGCMELPPSPYAFKEPREYEFATQVAEAFTTSCQRVVTTKAELAQAKSEGWRESPEDALRCHAGEELDTEQAAAEVAYAVQRMSERAQAEYREESASNPEHVTDVKRKPGRPPRVDATE